MHRATCAFVTVHSAAEPSQHSTNQPDGTHQLPIPLALERQLLQGAAAEQAQHSPGQTRLSLLLSASS